MEGVSLPHSEAEPVIQILFFLGECVKGETIGAGLLHWFAAVHAFIQYEKGERGTGLTWAVSGDFVHL